MRSKILAALFLSSVLSPALATAGGPAQTLPGKGGLRLDVALEVSVADGAFFEPIALAPDIYYGFHKYLVLAVTHSANSQGVASVGRALRLNGGGDKYGGLAFEAFFPLVRSGSLSIAPQVSFVVQNIDPALYGLKAGALGSFSAGAISFVANPYFTVPVNKRTGRDTTIHIPMWLYYHWKNYVSLYLLTGLQDEHLQLAGGALFNATEVLQIGTQYGWPAIAGDNGALDVTTFTVFGQARF